MYILYVCAHVFVYLLIKLFIELSADKCKFVITRPGAFQ